MIIFMLNLILLFTVLYIFSVQISAYNEVVFDRCRFRYFALRDQLAMLVINGKLEEDSWEYQTIVDTINFHINTVENLSIDKVMRVLVEYHISPQEEKVVRRLKKTTKNEEVIKILADFMDVTGKILARNSRAQLFLLNLIISREKNKKVKKVQLKVKKETALRYSFEERRLALDKVRKNKEILSSGFYGDAIAA